MLEVCAAFIIHENKFLITTRSVVGKNNLTSLLWEFPGGKVKEGESEESCIIREIKEELNIDIKPLKRIFSLNFFNNGERLLLHFIRSKLYPRELYVLPNNNQEYKWVTFEELYKFNFLTPDKIFIIFLKEFKDLLLC